MLTERGTTFGYNDLVVDFRNIPEMKKLRRPCHHGRYPFAPAAKPGFRGYRRPAGYDRDHCESRDSDGCDGLFLETHPDPSVAKSDGANMLKLDLLEGPA